MDLDNNNSDNNDVNSSIMVQETSLHLKEENIDNIDNLNTLINSQNIDLGPFLIGPSDLYELVDPKNIDLFNDLGGINGIANRLKTDIKLGLSYYTLRNHNLNHNHNHNNLLEKDIDDESNIPYIKTNTQKSGKSFKKSFSEARNTFTSVLSGKSNHYEKHVIDHQQRQMVYGTNTMPEPVRTSLWKFMLDTLKDKTLIVLCIAAVVEIAVGIYKTIHDNNNIAIIDGVAIIIAVLIVVLVSSINDYRKQAQFRKLNDFSKTLSVAKVIRDGKVEEIQIMKLLVGDIITVETGDVIPADGILISGFNVDLDESSLTGEPIAIHKNTTKDPFLLSGTKVLNGIGKMMIINTGVNSMSGRTMLALEVEPEETPLQHKLGRVADDVAKFGVTAAILMVIALLIAYFTAAPWRERSSSDVANDVIGIFITAITLVVVAVPEGLPLAVTLSLAHATICMLADQNMVRHLAACETMGNATTICSDKTGTLTINKMTIVAGICLDFEFDKTILPIQLKGRIIGQKLTPNIQQNSIDFNIDDNLVAGSTDLIKTETLSSNKINEKINNIEIKPIINIPATNLKPTKIEIQTPKTAAHLDEISFVEDYRYKLLKLLCFSLNINSTAAETTSQDGKIIFSGSKTEVAILQWTNSLGFSYSEDREKSDIKFVQPFSSERKRMSLIFTTEHESDFEDLTDLSGYPHLPQINDDNRRHWLAVKGASEIVMRGCTHYFDENGKVKLLDKKAYEKFNNLISEYSSNALRTIGVAIRPYHDISFDDSDEGSISSFECEKCKKEEKEKSEFLSVTKADIDGGSDNDDEKEKEKKSTCTHQEEPKKKIVNDLDSLIFCGLFGIQDPVRKEVPEAVATCMRAGITVRMVTGDNELTARAIAKECGILTDEGIVMEGPVFRNLTESEMDRILPHLQVLARSSPLDKQVLVRNLKRLKETVAVTGDGTNDAPALKGSDVGFAMGITGTEVAKEASDIIILDDNFASIVKAVLWGRSVYDSVRKFLQFQLTVNISAVVVTIVTSIVSTTSNLYQPAAVLTAVQLLWVNLIMDTLAALALATDPPTLELLSRPPSRRTESIISVQMAKMIVGQAIYQIIMCIILFFYADDWFGIDADAEPDAELGINVRPGTVVFNAFVFCQIFNEINSRSITRDLNIFRGITKNYIFIGIFFITAFLQTIIVEFGGIVFKAPKNGLSWKPWLVCVAIGFGSIPVGFLIRLIPPATEFLPEWMIMKRFRNVGEESINDAYSLEGYVDDSEQQQQLQQKQQSVNDIESPLEGTEAKIPIDKPIITTTAATTEVEKDIKTDEFIKDDLIEDSIKSPRNSLQKSKDAELKLRSETQRQRINAVDRSSWNTMSSSSSAAAAAVAAAATAAYSSSMGSSVESDAPLPDMDEYAESMYTRKGLGGHEDLDSYNLVSQQSNAKPNTHHFYSYQAAGLSPSASHQQMQQYVSSGLSPAPEVFSAAVAWRSAIRRTQLQLRVIRAFKATQGVHRSNNSSNPQLDSSLNKSTDSITTQVLSELARRSNSKKTGDVQQNDLMRQVSRKSTISNNGRLSTNLDNNLDQQEEFGNQDIPIVTIDLEDEPNIIPLTERPDSELAHIINQQSMASTIVPSSANSDLLHERSQEETPSIVPEITISGELSQSNKLDSEIDTKSASGSELWNKARVVPKTIGVVNALRGGRRRNEDLAVLQMVDPSSVRLRAAQQNRTQMGSSNAGASISSRTPTTQGRK